MWTAGIAKNYTDVDYTADDGHAAPAMGGGVIIIHAPMCVSSVFVHALRLCVLYG
jgi:hypothetical protein